MWPSMESFSKRPLAFGFELETDSEVLIFKGQSAPQGDQTMDATPILDVAVNDWSCGP